MIGPRSQGRRHSRRPPRSRAPAGNERFYRRRSVGEKLALIYAWTGEKDLAFEQLAIAARIPGYLSYGELRFAPVLGSVARRPAL